VIMALDRLRPASELAASRPHGDRLKYVGGCRCAECRAANAAYERMRQHARKAGDWNGIVPAVRARRHLLMLSLRGIGRLAVAAATDLSRTNLAKIRAGRRHNIRARTERKILLVTTAARSDGSLVPSAMLWRRLGELLNEGYTKSFLARELGYVGPALQFSRGKVTARNDADVERLHRKLTT